MQESQNGPDRSHLWGVCVTRCVWAKRKMSSKHAQMQASVTVTAPEENCKCNVNLKRKLFYCYWSCETVVEYMLLAFVERSSWFASCSIQMYLL